MEAPLPKVLVVDDDQSQRVWFEGVLKKYFDVRLANDAEDAMTIIENEGDIMSVVCDICLSGEEDGFEILDRVAGLSGVPVILVTGVGNKEKAIRALRAGAFDYLEKPCNPCEVIVVLSRAVEFGNDRYSRQM